MKNYLLTFVLCLFFFGNINSQVPVSSELYLQFEQKDSLLFSNAFNQCNFEATKKMMADDLEFYHDKGGFQNKAQFLKAVQENICSGAPQKPLRKLVPNTLKIFPLYDNGELYGVLQQGEHQFYIKEPEKEAYLTGSALFSTLWIKEKDTWLVKRVYSYEHKGA